MKLCKVLFFVLYFHFDIGMKRGQDILNQKFQLNMTHESNFWKKN